MAKIVAFTVPSLSDGDTAIAQLSDAEEVKDAALVYVTDDGKVKLHQSTDLTFGEGAGRGALLGAAVGIFAGPFLGVTAAGAAAGGLIAKLHDHGVSDELMKLAGEQLEAGQAAVFVLAEDAAADEIVSRIDSLSNLKQYQGRIEVGEFSADAQKLVKEELNAVAAW